VIRVVSKRPQDRSQSFVKRTSLFYAPSSRYVSVNAAKQKDCILQNLLVDFHFTRLSSWFRFHRCRFR
jgi:hypothetical protein